MERVAEHVCVIDRGRLVMNLPLDEMREGYRRITAGFTAPQPSERFRIQGLLEMKNSGRQVTLIATQNADAVIELVRSMEPVSVDVVPITLCELFLAAVREEF